MWQFCQPRVTFYSCNIRCTRMYMSVNRLTKSPPPPCLIFVCASTGLISFKSQSCLRLKVAVFFSIYCRYSSWKFFTDGPFRSCIFKFSSSVFALLCYFIRCDSSLLVRQNIDSVCGLRSQKTTLNITLNYMYASSRSNTISWYIENVASLQTVANHIHFVIILSFFFVVTLRRGKWREK